MQLRPPSGAAGLRLDLPPLAVGADVYIAAPPQTLGSVPPMALDSHLLDRIAPRAGRPDIMILELRWVDGSHPPASAIRPGGAPGQVCRRRCPLGCTGGCWPPHWRPRWPPTSQRTSASWTSGSPVGGPQRPCGSTARAHVGRCRAGPGAAGQRQARRRGHRRTAPVLLRDPAWCRKSPKITEVLPLLHLHGLSSKDFTPALEGFLGTDAGPSATTFTRLTVQWQDDRFESADRRRGLA